ncbi:MAG: CreA family protein [Reyranella sp.]|nr:CreA family protein [Reyranella sp.]MDP3162197.1 CreA family protein [Reyranella sp.]
MMRAVLASLALLLALPAMAEEIGSVSYRFKWLGPNDKIAVEAFDDPDVAGVTCYIARARTGGIKGAFGVAEDPAQVSISCQQTRAIDPSTLDKLKSPHEVFSERASLIFKTTQVVRFWDPKRRALVYLTYTDRVIEGSPQNSISVVPVGLK